MAISKKRGARRKQTVKQSVKSSIHLPVLGVVHWYWGVGLVLAVALFAGASQLWSFLNDPLHMPIEVVKVDGDLQHVSRTDLQKKVLDSVDGSFFSVNVSKVKKAARQVPWVNDVQVRKIWPNILSVTVDEHKAYAMLNKQHLVNARGELFSPAKSSFPKGLVNFVGRKADINRLWNGYLTMQKKLSALGKRMVRLELSDRGAWTFQLADKANVLLGSTDIAQRFDRFTRIYPELTRQVDKKPLRFDMRYSNGLAVLWDSVELDMSNEDKMRGKS